MRKEGLHIDSKNNQVFWHGKHIGLSPFETRFLEILYMFQGRAVPVDDIMDYLYHDAEEEPFQNILQVFASLIRKKIPDLLLGKITAIGYILCETREFYEAATRKRFDSHKNEKTIHYLKNTMLFHYQIAEIAGVKLQQVDFLNSIYNIRTQKRVEISDEKLKKIHAMNTKERKNLAEKLGCSLSSINNRLVKYRKKHGLSRPKRTLSKKPRESHRTQSGRVDREETNR